MEREEMENHGRLLRNDGGCCASGCFAMKEIWTKDEAEYHGDSVNFDKLWSYPSLKEASPAGVDGR